MITSPLLSNVRDRAMMTPVSPLCITAVSSPHTKTVEPVLKFQTPNPAPGI